MMSDDIPVCPIFTPITRFKSYRIALLQFWRGQKDPLRLYPLHWALYVKTGPDVGNTYEIVGDENTYTFRTRINQPLENKEDCRGGCYVGRVNSEAQLAAMGDILAKVNVRRNYPLWNSHDWVVTALRTLEDSGFGIYSEQFKWPGLLQNTMLCELESWPGIENGVEFVGHEYLECVIQSKFRSELWKSERRGQNSKPSVLVLKLEE